MNIFRRLMGNRTLEYKCLLVTLISCDRNEYFIRDFNDVEFDVETFDDYKDLLKGIEIFSDENQERIKEFLNSNTDYIDIESRPVSENIGRRWFIMFKIKNNLKVGGIWHYRKIYDDVITSNKFSRYNTRLEYDKIFIRNEKYHL